MKGNQFPTGLNIWDIYHNHSDRTKPSSDGDGLLKKPGLAKPRMDLFSWNIVLPCERQSSLDSSRIGFVRSKNPLQDIFARASDVKGFNDTTTAIKQININNNLLSKKCQ